MQASAGRAGTIAHGAAAAAAAPTAAPGSLGFQITSDHRGAIVTTGLKPPLSVRWAVNLGGPASYPIVVGGIVYVVGGKTSALWALAESTGHPIWRQPVPQGFNNWTDATYDNGQLFLRPFQSGAVFAYDAATGRPRWSANIPGEYASDSGTTAYGGLLYMSSSGGADAVAMQESNGLVIWMKPVLYGDSSTPAVNATGVYVSYACPQAYRFSLATGILDWHYAGPCAGGGGATPAIYGDRLYVRDIEGYPTDGLILDATTGAPIGGFNSSYSPVFVGTTAVYTEATSVTAVDITTGATEWSVVPPAGDDFSCAPIVANDVVYVPTSGKALFGYRINGGRMVVAQRLPSAVQCGTDFGGVPTTGLGAGDGLLVVPAGNVVEAFQ